MSTQSFGGNSDQPIFPFQDHDSESVEQRIQNVVNSMIKSYAYRFKSTISRADIMGDQGLMDSFFRIAKNQVEASEQQRIAEEQERIQSEIEKQRTQELEKKRKKALALKEIAASLSPALNKINTTSLEEQFARNAIVRKTYVAWQQYHEGDSKFLPIIHELAKWTALFRRTQDGIAVVDIAGETLISKGRTYSGAKWLECPDEVRVILEGYSFVPFGIEPVPAVKNQQSKIMPYADCPEVWYDPNAAIHPLWQEHNKRNVELYRQDAYRLLRWFVHSWDENDNPAGLMLLERDVEGGPFVIKGVEGEPFNPMLRKVKFNRKWFDSLAWRLQGYLVSQGWYPAK